MAAAKHSASSSEGDNSTLINSIVQYVKSEGIFDQLRKECLQDIDKRESYTHLKQRVESHVANFLSKQVWSEETSKNKLRDSLRTNIRQSDVLQRETLRLIDQVVHINCTSFLSRLQNVVEDFLSKDKQQDSSSKEKSKPDNKRQDTKTSAKESTSDSTPGSEVKAETSETPEKTPEVKKTIHTPLKKVHSKLATKSESKKTDASPGRRESPDVFRSDTPPMKEAHLTKRAQSPASVTKSSGRSGTPPVGPATRDVSEASKTPPQPSASKQLSYDTKRTVTPPPPGTITKGNENTASEPLPPGMRSFLPQTVHQVDSSSSMDTHGKEEPVVMNTSVEKDTLPVKKEVKIEDDVEQSVKESKTEIEDVEMETKHIQERKKTIEDKVTENTFQPIKCYRRESVESVSSSYSKDNDQSTDTESLSRIPTESVSAPEDSVTREAVLSDLEMKAEKREECVEKTIESDAKSDISDISSVHTSDLSSFEEEPISDISDIEVSESDSESDGSSDAQNVEDKETTAVEKSGNIQPTRRSTRRASQESNKESSSTGPAQKKEKRSKQRANARQEKETQKTRRKVGRPKGSTKQKRSVQHPVKQEVQQPVRQDRPSLEGDQTGRRSKRQIKPTRCYSPSNEEEREIYVPTKRQRTISQ